jgi:hypothetical protein
MHVFVEIISIAWAVLVLIVLIRMFSIRTLASSINRYDRLLLSACCITFILYAVAKAGVLLRYW